MSNHFYLTRYIQLLKKRENERLSDEEYCEFFSYGSAVQGQISYNRKEDYFSLIKEYLDERINPWSFVCEVADMELEDAKAEEILSKDFKQLSTFSIDSKSKEFASLIDQISNCYLIVREFGLEDSNGITEDEFLESINKSCFQIQNCLDK